MTTPNVELLRQTMDEILAYPEKHRQNYWAQRTDCGTAYCFAGMACHISGAEAVFSSAMANLSGYLGDGNAIVHAATQLLGIDYNTAHYLFDAANTTADLKHYVDEIAEHGRIIESVR